MPQKSFYITAKSIEEKLNINNTIWLTLAVFIITFVYLLARSPVSFAEYSINMRSIFFSAFFTMASFLLASKNLIVLNMWKEVYSTDDYVKVIFNNYYKYEYNINGLSPEEIKDIDPQSLSSYDFVGSLRRTTNLLTLSIYSAFLTSLMQMLLGFYESSFSVAVCLSLSASTLFLACVSLLVIRLNFIAIFEAWNKQKNDKLKELFNTFKEDRMTRPNP